MNKQYDLINFMLERKIFDVNSEIYVSNSRSCFSNESLVTYYRVPNDFCLRKVRDLLLEDFNDFVSLKILIKYDKIKYEEQKISSRDLVS